MAKSKYVVTMRVTGSDYEEVRGWFGHITRKGTMAEIIVEANDERTAKDLVRQLAAKHYHLIEGVKKV